MVHEGLMEKICLNTPRLGHLTFRVVLIFWLSWSYFNLVHHCLFAI